MKEEAKKNVNFYGAVLLFVIVIAITVSLFFFEIPEKNNDVIKLIIGVLVGSLSPIIFSILGKDPQEVEKKNIRIQHLETQNNELQNRVDHLDKMFMDLQAKVIDKLSELSK